MTSTDLTDLSTAPPLVRGGEDRNGKSLHFLNGRFDCKISGADNAGALCVYDTWRTEPGGPPVHVHDAQDEWFFVLEGDFIVRVGETIYKLASGDSIIGPRGIPHSFRCMSQTGRLVVAFQPAGTMEAFFASGGPTGKPSPEEFAALSLRHGMTVVGPPLSEDDAKRVAN